MGAQPPERANNWLRLAVIIGVCGASWLYQTGSNDVFEGPFPLFGETATGSLVGLFCVLVTDVFWVYTLKRLIDAAARQPGRSRGMRAAGCLVWAIASLVSCGLNLSNIPSGLPGGDPLSRARGECGEACWRIDRYVAAHGGRPPVTQADLHAIWAAYAIDDANHPFHDHMVYYPAEPVLEADLPATAPTRVAAEAGPQTPAAPPFSSARARSLYYARIVPSNGMTWRGFTLAWDREATARLYVVGHYDGMGRPWLAASGPSER